MRLNYSKEAIDSEFDLFEITTEYDWFLSVCPLLHLSVCKYILHVQQIANVCVCVCVCVCVSVCVSGGWFCQHSDSVRRRVLLSES